MGKIFKKGFPLTFSRFFLTLSKEQNKVWCKCNGDLVGFFNIFMNEKGHIGIRPMSTNMPRLLVLFKRPVTLKLLHWRLKDSNTFSIVVASIKRDPNFLIQSSCYFLNGVLSDWLLAWWHFFLEFFHRQNRLIKTIKEFDLQKLLTAVIDMILVCFSL